MLQLPILKVLCYKTEVRFYKTELKNEVKFINIFV